MRDSKILIFDEPLAGLDENTREKVIKMIGFFTDFASVFLCCRQMNYPTQMFSQFPFRKHHQAFFHYVCTYLS